MIGFLLSENRPDNSTVPPAEAAVFFGLVALLTFAPLFLGTSRPLPLMFLEVAALGLLAGLFATRQNAFVAFDTAHRESKPLPGGIQLFVAMLFLLPLAQLLPVPMGLWELLPGRTFYAESIRQALDDGSNDGWRSLSLIPSATEAAWLSLLPPVAVFLAALRLGQERLLILLLIFLGIATAEAIFGLAQYGSAAVSDSALGTYRNRNHLAGLLEMALPVALALLAATVGHSRPPSIAAHRARRNRTFRQWLARFSVARINQAAALGGVALAILLGLVFTRSRAGIGLGMLGILLCTLMFSYRLGGRNAYGLTGTVTAVGLGLAGMVGLAPVWSRFAYADPFEDGRWKIFDATLQAIGEFFPLGSGAGTFVEVMHRFHPATLPGVTVNRAHNDPLEWLLEFGLIAGVCMAIWLLFYANQWLKIWSRGEWTPFRFAQAGAGIALILMMLHSLVDYNLRTPANAVFAAFLAAVFFHLPPRDRRIGALRQRESARGGARASTDYLVPPENRKNPFRI